MLQQGTVTPIKIIQSANGKRMKSFQEKLLTAVISLATTGIISCAGFLWKVNGAVARLEEIQIENDRINDDMQKKIDDIQLNVFDTKERLIRIETLQKK